MYLLHCQKKEKFKSTTKVLKNKVNDKKDE